jgi:hypothetical protein
LPTFGNYLVDVPEPKVSIDLAADVSCEKSADAPGNEIEISPAMIEAGAEAMMDGSNFGSELSRSVAEYFSERVIRAALGAFSHGTL